MIEQVLLFRRDLYTTSEAASKAPGVSLQVFLDRAQVFLDRALAQDEDRPNHFLYVPLTPEMAHWLEGPRKTTILWVSGREPLIQAYQEAKARGFSAALIRDPGKTPSFQTVSEGAEGVVVLGPADSKELRSLIQMLHTEPLE